MATATVVIEGNKTILPLCMAAAVMLLILISSFSLFWFLESKAASSAKRPKEEDRGPRKRPQKSALGKKGLASSLSFFRLKLVIKALENIRVQIRKM